MNELVFSNSQEFITSPEAALRYGCSTEYIGRLCRQKKLQGILMGRVWQVEVSSLESLIAEKKPLRIIAAQELAKTRREEYKAYQEKLEKEKNQYKPLGSFYSPQEEYISTYQDPAPAAHLVQKAVTLVAAIIFVLGSATTLFTNIPFQAIDEVKYLTAGSFSPASLSQLAATGEVVSHVSSSFFSPDSQVTESLWSRAFSGLQSTLSLIFAPSKTPIAKEVDVTPGADSFSHGSLSELPVSPSLVKVPTQVSSFVLTPVTSSLLGKISLATFIPVFTSPLVPVQKVAIVPPVVTAAPIATSAPIAVVKPLTTATPTPTPVSVVKPVTTSTPKPVAAPIRTSVVQTASPATVIQKVVEVVNTGVEKSYVDAQINALRNSLTSEIYKGNSAQYPGVSNYSQSSANVSIGQTINALSGVTISNSTVRGITGLTDADIPDNITVTGYLSTTGGTLGGPLVVSTTSTSTFSGPIVATGLQLSGLTSCSSAGTDSSGNLICGSGGGGGSDGNWVYFNASGIRLATTTNQVVIGASATTSLATLEVRGSQFVSGSSVFGNNVQASTFTATSTSASSTFPNLAVTNFALGSQYLTSFTGSGLLLTNGVLSVDPALSAFSTTSANFWASTGLAFSTTSENYYKSVNNFFSTTSASFFSSAGLAFSTTSNDNWKSVNNFFSTTSSDFYTSSGLSFSTTSADAWKSVRNFFSTTSSDYYTSLGLAFSTTSNDAWKGARNFFSTTSSDFYTSSGLSFSTTSASNFFRNGLAFSTTTNNTFTGGNMFLASTTIGAGGQTTGLTISGGATTTGNALFQGFLSAGTTTLTNLLVTNVATSTFNGMLTVSGGVSLGRNLQYQGLEVYPNGKTMVAGGLSNAYGYPFQVGGDGIFTKSIAISGSGGTSPEAFIDRTLTYLNIYGSSVGIGSTNGAPSLYAQSTSVVVGDATAGGYATIGNATLEVRRNIGSVAKIGIYNLGTADNSQLSFGNGIVSTGHTDFFSIGNDTADDNKLKFANGSLLTTNTRMTLTQSGNLGLGTTSPSATLAVQGNSIFSGTSFFGGAITATSTLSVSGLSTLMGLLSSASSTIGSGAQNGGLTINGGATTTGNSYFNGAGRFTGTLSVNTGTCAGGQALQTNSSGDIICGSIVTGGNSVGGGWTTNNIGSITLATTSDRVGIGATSTPYAKLSILSGSTATTTLALVPAVGQTANILDIYNTAGNLSSVFTAAGSLGIGTTSPGTLLSLGDTGVNTVNISTTATSTFGYGIDVRNGCFSIAGTCITSATFAYPFPNNATSTALMFLASTTIGGGTNTSGLTISGGATTTGNAYFAANAGFGSSSPFARVSIDTPAGASGSLRTLFAIASSTGSATSTFLTVSNTGLFNFTSNASVFINGSTTIGNGTQTGGLTISGAATTTGILAVTGTGTSTFSGNISVSNLAQTGSATSTFSNGLNIADGCFSVNGNCLQIFSTTSANYWSTLGLGFSTSSASYFLSQNQGTAFSTSSSDYWKSVNNFFSTTSASFFSSAGLAFSTTSTNYLISQPTGQGIAFSTTSSSNFFRNGLAFSTTTNNTFTGSNMFLASTTIGAGGATTGLTISGGATTTGNAYFAGSFSVNGVPLVNHTATFYAADTSSQALVKAIRKDNSQNAAFGVEPTGAITSSNVGWNFGLGGNSNNFIIGTWDGSVATNRFFIGNTGNVGIGTSSPFAQLSIATPDQATGALRTLFAVASSTATATTTLFSIDNTGALTQTGGATSTFSNGFNIAAGCFSVNGNCLQIFSTTSADFYTSSGLSFSTTSADAWKSVRNFFSTTSSDYFTSLGLSFSTTSASNFFRNGLAFSTTTNNTFTGSNMFLASTTIGNGTQAGGLTISGGATTTGNAYFAGTVGVGTTSPTSKLSVHGDAFISGTAFIGGALTSTSTFAFSGSGTSTIAGNLDLSNNFNIGGASNGFGFVVDTIGQRLTIESNNNNYGVQIGSNYLETTGVLGAGGALGVNSLYGVNFNQDLTFRLADAGGTFSEKGRLTTASFLGLGTSSPGTNISLGSTGVNTVNISASATSTFGSGLNIRTGCFAVNGNCLPLADTSFSTTSADYYTSLGLSFSTTSASNFFRNGLAFSTTTNNIFTGANMFLASTTIGDGTQTGGLTISGGATTTGNFQVGTSSSHGFRVINNAATAGNGLSLTTTGAGSGVTLAAISNATNENLTILAKGASGNVTISTGSSGQILFSINGPNFTQGASYSTFTPAASAALGTQAQFAFTGAANTALTASTEAPDVNFNLAQTKTHSNGAIALQRSFLINAPTQAFTSFNSGNNIITDLASFSIDGANALGTHAKATNSYALLIGTSTASTRLNASTTNAYGLAVFADAGATNNYAAIFQGGNVGAGTTSPFAKLSIQTNSSETNRTLFAIASSTASATTTLFSIDNTGALTQTGGATSTFSNGFNIAAGCFSVNGNCLQIFSTTSANYFTSLGLSFSTTSADAWKGVRNFFSTTSSDFYTSSGLSFSTTSTNYLISQPTGQGIAFSTTSASNFFRNGLAFSTTTNNTFTGSNMFLASTTIGAGGQTTGLTISGGATTTGFLTVQGTATSSFAGTFQIGTSSNHGFLVYNNAATAGNGLALTTTAAGSGVMLSAVSSATNEAFTIRAKGSSNLNLESAFTGGASGGVYITPGGNTTASFFNTSVTFTPSAYSNNFDPQFKFTGSSNVNLTALNEAPDAQWNFAQTKTHNNGALALQRSFLINAPTEAFTSYSNGTNVITDLATLGITGAPITLASGNGTTTNAHTIYLGASALNASTTNSYGLTVNANTGATNNYAAIFQGGNVGAGTTSPFAKLSIQTNSSETNRTLFAIASSTATATTTLFSIDNTGALTQTGGATSTFSNGFNIAAGCFSVNGNCLQIFSTTSANFWSTLGLGFSTTSENFYVSAGLSFSTTSASNFFRNGLAFSTTTNNTFTGANMFLASTTIGAGGQTTGLTISGGATTTGNLFVSGALGVGVQNNTAGSLQTNTSLTVGTIATITGSPTLSNLNLPGVTSGTGIAFPSTSSVTSGSLLSYGVSGSTGGGQVAFTGKLINLASTRSASNSVTDTGNFLNFVRNYSETAVGNTYTVTGDLATLASNCSQAGGNCVDSSSILSLYQYATSSGTGAVFSVNSGSTGQLIALNATSTSATSTIVSLFNQTFLTASSTGFNTGLGLGANAKITTASNNTAIGYLALANATSTNDNTAIGYQALLGNPNNFTGNSNVAVGLNTLRSVSTGSSNAAVGYQALVANSSGSFNSAFGQDSLFNNTTGSSNSAFGLQALYNNKASDGNAAFGYQALYRNMTGANNVAMGREASVNNFSATSTVAIGYQAALGTGAGYNAQNYTIIGYQAGLNLATGGDGNTFLGFNAGSNVTTGWENIIIGNSNALGATPSKALNIGNLLFGANIASSTALSTGQIGIGSTSPFARLSVHANNGDTNRTLFAVASSTASATTTLFSVSNTGQVLVPDGSATSPSYSFSANAATGFYSNGSGSSQRVSLSMNGADRINLYGSGTNNINDFALGPIQAPLGGAALPTYAERISGSTGIFFPSSANIGFSTQGVERTRITSTAFGIGTTSPFARLSVHANNGETNTSLFAVASSTASATTTLFSIDNTGALTQTGGATSTFSNGFNIAAGCFAVNNACLPTADTSFSTTSANFWSTAGLGFSTTSENFYVSAGLSFSTTSASNFFRNGLAFSTTTNNIFTGSNMFLASTTIGAGGQTTGLTISGGATTTGNLFVSGAIGVGVQNNTAGSLETNTSLTVGTNAIINGSTGNILNLAGTNTTATGILVNVTSITSGQGILMNPNNNTAFNNFSGAYIKVSGGRGTGQALVDTGNFLQLNRRNTANAAGTFTNSGDLATFSSNCIQAGATCTDTASVLSLYQYATSSGTGAVFSVNSGSTGQLIALNATSSNATSTIVSLFNQTFLTASSTGFNTGLGLGANANITSASSNTAIGYLALGNAMSTSNNVAIGHQALLGSATNFTGNSNVAVGYNSMKFITTGSSNAAVGYQALNLNTTGGQNSAFGPDSLFVNTTGSGNSAFGLQALYNNRTADGNAAFGYQALYRNMTGANNVAMGREASFNNFSATSTVAIGYQAALGTGAGYNAQNYTIIGYQAGLNLATGGDGNTFLGFNAGSNVTTGWENIIIGNSNALGATPSKALNIGNLLFGANIASSTALSTGQIGIGSTSPFARLSIHANNGDTNRTLFAVASSTASATTTLFSIDNTGALTQTGGATSTFSNGFNISAGCFAINNACLPSVDTAFSTTSANFWSTLGLGFSTTSENFYVSAGLSFSTTSASNYFINGLAFSTTTNNTFTGSNMFLASTTIGAGGQTTGLTVSGGSTTTLSAYFATSVGIGTSSLGTNKLSVSDTTGSAAWVRFCREDASFFCTSLSGTNGAFTMSNSGSGFYQFANGGTLSSGNVSSGTIDLTIRGGMVAVGTTTNNTGTGGHFQIWGKRGFTDYFQVTNADAGTASPTGDIFKIDGSGRLGIGTTTPTQALSIQGSGLFSGNINAASITATSTVTALGGLLATASSTIGAGATTTGLTISGGATTTGTAYFASKVGIGSSTPWNSLAIEGNGTNSLFNGIVNIKATASVSNSASANTWFTGYDDTGTWRFILATSNSSNNNQTTFYTSAGLTLQSSSVMITNGGGAGTLKFGNGGGYIQGNSGSDAFHFMPDNGAERVTFLNGGNVGIGSTTPSALLSVHGNSITSGSAFFGGAITATSTFTLTGLATLNGGLISFASTTIGGGATTTGLTISGGATTTGTAYFAGKVGVGTNTPTGLLHLKGALNSNLISFTDTTNNQTVGIQMTTPAGSGPDLTIGIGSDRTIFSPTYAVRFNGANIEGQAGFTFLNNGGTFSAQGASAFNLQTSSNNIQLFSGGIDANTVIRSYGGANYTMVQGVAGQTGDIFQVASSSGTVFTNVTASGNVGIGTTTPAARLSIDTSSLGTSPAFLVGSSTLPSFVISNGGLVGIGGNPVRNKGAGLTLATTTYMTNGSLSLNCDPTSASFTANYALQICPSVVAPTQSLVNLAVTSGSFDAYVQFSMVGSSFSSSNVQWLMGTPGNQGNQYAFANWDGSQINSALAITNALNFGFASTTPGSKSRVSIEMPTNRTAFLVGHNGSSTPAFSIGGVNENGRIGVATTSTLMASTTLFGIEQNDEATSFVVSHSGSSTPSFMVGGVNSNGRVGVGTSTSGISAASALLIVGNSSVVGNVATFGNSNGVCSINPTGTSLSCSSDRTLKKNILDLGAGVSAVANAGMESTSTLDLIMKLRPVTYNWNSEQNGTATHSGFIAQEVLQLMPDLVSMDDNGKYGLNYAGFTPYLVKGMQEQQAEINDMKLGSTSIAEIITATTSTSTTTPWAGAFANVSQALKTSLSALSLSVVQAYKSGIYAVVGVFDEVFAKKIHTDELCVSKSDGTELCITGDQLASVMAGNNTPSTPPSDGSGNGSGNGGGAGTSTPDTQAPVISLNGVTPSNITVGDTYSDLGVTVTDNVDANVSFTTTLDGVSTPPNSILIDTSAPGTHVIVFSATDAAGNTGMATRTVEVGSGGPQGTSTPPTP